MTLVDTRDLAEDRRVEPDRTRLEERHDMTVRADGFARIYGPDLAAAQHVGGDIDLATDTERSSDVHHAPEGQDAQGGLRSEQILGDEMDGAVAPCGDDHLDAVGDRLTDDRPCLGLSYLIGLTRLYRTWKARGTSELP